jgi:tetratricopeptide (TPR) repeat protein
MDELHLQLLTGNVISIPRLALPKFWDQLFYSADSLQLYQLLENITPSTITRIRQAHVLANLQDYEKALEHLQDLTEAPAMGVRAICLAMLGQDDAVLNQAPLITRLPLEYESNAYLCFAKSISLSAQNKFVEAQRYVEDAEDFATRAGMHNRLLSFKIERERLNIYQGNPNPLELNRIGNLVQNQRTKIWAENLFISACLYSGRYATARQHWTPNNDIFEAALSEALSNEPRTLRSKDTKQHQLVMNVEALWQHDYRAVHKVKLDDLLENNHSRVIYALAKYRLGEYHVALNALAETPPVQPDAAVWWHIIRLGLLIRLESNFVFAQFTWRGLSDALERLGSHQHLVKFLCEFLPHETWLACQHIHHPALESAVAHMPLLSNKQLSRGSHKIRLARTITTAIIQDGLHDESWRFEALHRQQKKRFREALATYGATPKQLLNVGTLSWMLERLEERERYFFLWKTVHKGLKIKHF